MLGVSRSRDRALVNEASALQELRFLKLDYQP